MGLPKLPPAGTHALQVDGRLDIASFRLYEDPMLDWILAVYNAIRYFGSDEPYQETGTIHLTLEAGRHYVAAVPIRSGDLQIIYGGAKRPVYTNPDGSQYSTFGGTTILITYQASGGVRIRNEAESDVLLTVTFQIVYIKYLKNNFLMAGQQILYPDIEAVRTLLSDVRQTEEAASFTGFNRL